MKPGDLVVALRPLTSAGEVPVGTVGRVVHASHLVFVPVGLVRVQFFRGTIRQSYGNFGPEDVAPLPEAP